MKPTKAAAAVAALFMSMGLFAQAQTTVASQTPSSAAGTAGAAYFIDPTTLDLASIVPPPPARDSEVTKAELVELHRIEQARTPAQVAAAQADDKEQDIFIYTDVMGKSFTPQDLPLTAALSAQVHKAEGLASAPLKTAFERLRPYQLDPSLHPVCAVTKEPSSYPSGHALSGYLLALTLIEIVPEKRQQILERADEYSHNRMVCGVHYPSDLEASRRIAYLVFGNMSANPRFQSQLLSARKETRQHLGLPITMPTP